MASGLQAMCTDCRVTAYNFQTAYDIGLTPSNTPTPTVTPTYTPLPVPVVAGSVHRIFSVGNSHISAGDCGGLQYDGFRPTLAASLNDGGYSAYYVGTYLRTSNPPRMQNSYTNGVGATLASYAYQEVTSNMPSVMTTPTSNDRVLIMSCINDASIGYTAAQEKAVQYATVTKVAALLPLCKIWLTNDYPRLDLDCRAVQQGVRDAYDQLVTDGYGSQVLFIDTNSMLDMNTYCPGDGVGHITNTGYDGLGVKIAQYILSNGF